MFLVYKDGDRCLVGTVASELFPHLNISSLQYNSKITGGYESYRRKKAIEKLTF